MPLAKDLPYLPDILRQHGYHTAAFVGSQILIRRVWPRLASTVDLRFTMPGSIAALPEKTVITAWSVAGRSWWPAP